MKYLKYFENNSEPQIGDYAVVVNMDPHSQLQHHIGNIGIIIDIISTNAKNLYVIDYEYDEEFSAYLDEFISSKSKDELEMIIQSQKYNL